MYSAFNSAFSFNYWPIASKKTWGPVITLSKASWPVQCLKASIVNFSFPSFKARGILTCPLLLLSLAQFHKDFRHSANFFAYFNIKTSIFVKQRFIVQFDKQLHCAIDPLHHLYMWTLLATLGVKLPWKNCNKGRKLSPKMYTIMLYTDIDFQNGTTKNYFDDVR